MTDLILPQMSVETHNLISCPLCGERGMLLGTSWTGALWGECLACGEESTRPVITEHQKMLAEKRREELAARAEERRQRVSGSVT